MIKRFTSALAVAAFLASTAPSASAEELRPAAGFATSPSMDQAVAGPATEQGVGTSPSSTEPLATEPVPAEQGFGSSPGVVEPVAPSPPAGQPTPTQKDKEGDDQATEEECEHRAGMIDDALDANTVWNAIADFTGSEYAKDKAHGWLDEVQALYEFNDKDGCYSLGGEQEE